MKPGYLTTEWWANVFVQVVGLLVVTGVIKPETQGQLAALIPAAALVAMAISQAIYSWSRGNVKVAMLSTMTPPWQA